jgi:hypothetical protein
MEIDMPTEQLIRTILPNNFGARFWQVHFEQVYGVRLSKRKIRRLSGKVWNKIWVDIFPMVDYT